MNRKLDELVQTESIEQTLDRQTAHIRSLQEEVDAMRPVVEAVQEWVSAVQYAHHCPTKRGYLKTVLKRLNDEVEDYEVWEKGL
jgi:hypothetical protein